MSKWIVVSGHGVWVPGETFVVPEGMTIKFFCSHGIYQLVDKNNIDQKARDKIQPSESDIKETLTSGKICHEYMLSYPKGVNPVGKAGKKAGNLYKIQKGEDVLLSSLLKNRKIDQCDIVYFYACRSAPRRDYLGDISKKGVKKMKQEFARSAAEKDLELFMEDRVKWELAHLDS